MIMQHAAPSGNFHPTVLRSLQGASNVTHYGSDESNPKCFTSVLDQSVPQMSRARVGQRARVKSLTKATLTMTLVMKIIQLLDEEESLELIQFNPTFNDGTTWEAGEINDSFLEKHFSFAISQQRSEIAIWGD